MGTAPHEDYAGNSRCHFRRAKTVAAECGIPFRALISEALADKLRAQGDRDKKPWMKTFGKLRHLHEETAKINRIIQEEFDQINSFPS